MLWRSEESIDRGCGAPRHLLFRDARYIGEFMP
jgi:hypothetical protein